MITSYSQEVEVQIQEIYKRLPEKSRRLYAGVEAACDTVLSGIKELNEEETLAPTEAGKRGRLCVRF